MRQIVGNPGYILSLARIVFFRSRWPCTGEVFTYYSRVSSHGKKVKISQRKRVLSWFAGSRGEALQPALSSPPAAVYFWLPNHFHLSEKIDDQLDHRR